MKTTDFRVGERLYTIYNTKGKFNDRWVVKVETVMPNRLFEEQLSEFWSLEGVVNYVKAMMDEIK